MRQNPNQQQQTIVREGPDRREQLDDVAAGRSEEAQLARDNVAGAVLHANGIDMSAFEMDIQAMQMQEATAAEFDQALTNEGLRPNAAADAAAAGQAIAKGAVEVVEPVA